MLRSNLIEPNDKNPVFLVFLINNNNQDITVVEVGETDFTKVKKRLEKGESAFVTRKYKQKVEPNLVANEELIDDPCFFFNHMEQDDCGNH